MPAITFDDFSVGKDLRKGASVSDANRLRELKNGYVTAGKAIRKRSGTSLVATLESGTKGLISGNGKLNTFYEDGTITHANSLFVANKVDHTDISTPVEKVHFGDAFNGFLYVAVEYQNGDVRHHYMDSSPSIITDSNVPHSKGVVKAEDKIWAVDGDIVRFSATGNPRDWTTASDAGFLPVGLKQRGSETARVLGKYKESNLVVFFDDGAQLWAIDPDPALHSFSQSLPGTASPYHRSIALLYQDLYILADVGFRSISEQALTGSQAELDIGSAIDSILAAVLPISPTDTPQAVFHNRLGQYMCAIGAIVHVYTVSKTSKVAAWSEYTFPWTIDDIATLNGKVYFRNGNNVFLLDDTVTTDHDGSTTVPYECEIVLPYLDAKKPGVLKIWTGADLVTTGAARLSFKYDPRDDNFVTSEITLSGDTRPGDMTPIELTSVNIAPVIKNNADEEFQLDAITLYFESLANL